MRGFSSDQDPDFKPLPQSKLAQVPPSPKTPKTSKSKTKSTTSSPNTTPGTDTRAKHSVRDLAQRPEVVDALIDIVNKRPSEFAPKIRILNSKSADMKFIKQRYLSGNMDTTIDVLYDDYDNNHISIIPNQPFKYKTITVPPLDGQFLKYILRAKIHKNKRIKYCLEWVRVKDTTIFIY